MWLVGKLTIHVCKMSGDDLQNLIELAYDLNGKHITVVESISRSRDVGKHDRHFATHTRFSFTVENVFVAFSGAQLSFMGEGVRYGISLDSVVSFQANGRELEIVEHFEQKTERQTHITAR